MPVEKEFFNVKYKEGSLDPKTAELIFFAVCVALGFENGARLHMGKARENGATQDELHEALVYAMRPAAAKVRSLGLSLIGQ
jgi:AhpD family alkylhydroperoxidase